MPIKSVEDLFKPLSPEEKRAAAEVAELMRPRPFDPVADAVESRAWFYDGPKGAAVEAEIERNRIVAAFLGVNARGEHQPYLRGPATPIDSIHNSRSTGFEAKRARQSQKVDNFGFRWLNIMPTYMPGGSK